MRYPPFPLVLRLAVPLAWLLLAGASAQAGFCALNSPNPLWQASGVRPFVCGEAQWEDISTDDGRAGLKPSASPPASEAPQPPVDFRLASLYQELPVGPQAGRCGASAPPPRLVTGAVGPPLLVCDKPALPRDERGRRLALETNSWDLPSFPSRLFRPPRIG